MGENAFWDAGDFFIAVPQVKSMRGNQWCDVCPLGAEWWVSVSTSPTFKVNRDGGVLKITLVVKKSLSNVSLLTNKVVLAGVLLELSDLFRCPLASLISSLHKQKLVSIACWLRLWVWNTSLRTCHLKCLIL